MTAEIGSYALILGMIVSAVTALLGLVGAHRRDPNLMAVTSYGMMVLFALVALAFAALTWAFVTNDFSVETVAANSNTAMPLLYRVTAVWGNHEGSLLLWVLILVIFGASIAAFGGGLPNGLKARVLAVQSALTCSFLALILFTSSPFSRLSPSPMEGQELNPLLQDIGLAIHPPFLYMGYVGFSVAFAFAVAALIEGRVDAAWARFARPWILAAWICLTIGIALGSFWAYYELGWGGWWFWDPVENASFMPWLIGTALLHSALVVERRGSLVVWTLLLAILAFSLSLIGTFLVRSGVLTSVHSFTADPTRGFGVLLILALTTGGALTLFAARAGRFGQTTPFALVSREGGLVLNNILLVTAAGTVFLGTFYPLMMELLTNDRISVGAPWFNRTFVPLMLPLFLAVVVGGNLRWKRDRLGAALKRGIWVLLPIALAFAAMVAFAGLDHIGGVLGIMLGLWLVLGSIAHWISRVQLFRVPLARALAMAQSAGRPFYGMVMAHLGLGLAVIGIATVTSFADEQIRSIAQGETVQVGGYDIRLDRVRAVQGPNYDAQRAVFVLSRNGAALGEMSSERRFFPASGNQTTEAGIRPSFGSNLYVVIGDPDGNGNWAVRAYWHPMVLFIWIGPLIMALGGLLSLTDRRFRIGAPSRKLAPVLAG